MEDLPVNIIFLQDQKITRFSKFLKEELFDSSIDSFSFIGTSIYEIFKDFSENVYKLKTILNFKGKYRLCRCSYINSSLFIDLFIHNSNFIKFIGYEIRTPVLAGVELTNLLSLTKTTEQQKKYLVAIKENNYELSRIINNASQYLKLLSSDVDIKKEKFNLTMAFDSIKKVITKDKKININFTLQDGIFLNTDKKKFIQMIVCVISYCIKSLGQSGMISIKVTVKKGFLNVFFTDTGNKMSKKTIDSLFKGFMEENYINSHYGLYLPIAKGISHSIGGELTLENSSDSGNSYKFSISLTEYDSSSD
jgi:K+-sensing histidine kinase KdpD